MDHISIAGVALVLAVALLCWLVVRLIHEINEVADDGDDF
jgi:hypothetical protein